MIIIKNFLRIILTLIILTIIAQSKESDKINKNEWVISLEQYFLSLGNIEGSFTQIDQIGNITKGIFYSNGKGSLRFEYFSPSEMLIIINKGIFEMPICVLILPYEMQISKHATKTYKNLGLNFEKDFYTFC